jgi:Animal haem peroxidase
VPRNQEGIALIGDPRNDVHVFVSQMQVAFIRAHNLLVDRLRADGAAEADLFDEARRSLSWHYQWVIVEEFLPLLVGSELVDELRSTGPRFYRPDGEPFIRSSSRTAPTATDTRRSRSSIDCNRTARSARCFPT